MHLDAEQLQRLLDGELGAEEESMARSHLGACADCRRRVEDGRADEADFVAWLAELDPPPLELSVESVLAKATRTPELSRWGRRAAAIVLAMGVAGGAYAMPGSPFPAWIDAWRGAEGEAPQASPAVASPPEARAGGGIAVDPGVRLTVVFSDLAPGATATVTVAESPNVVVQAENGTVSFDSDEDRLLVYGGASAASFDILLPDNAPSIEIRVDERVLLVKSLDRIETDGTLDEEGRYSLRLVP